MTAKHFKSKFTLNTAVTLYWFFIFRLRNLSSAFVISQAINVIGSPGYE